MARGLNVQKKKPGLSEAVNKTAENYGPSTIEVKRGVLSLFFC